MTNILVLIGALLAGALLQWAYMKHISTSKTDSLVALLMVAGIVSFICLVFMDLSQL